MNVTVKMKTSALCFVCGGKGPSRTLHVKPRDSGSYFSFLENHEPPKGARHPGEDGIVTACSVCHAFLNQQWDSFEKTKTPLVKRLYWLKRVDNRSFTGAEMNLQGEYVAQIMGLQYTHGDSSIGASPFDCGSHAGISCSVQHAPLPTSPNDDSNMSSRNSEVQEENGLSEGYGAGVLDLSISPKKYKARRKKPQIAAQMVQHDINRNASTTPAIKCDPSAGKTCQRVVSTSAQIVCYVCATSCPTSLARFIYAAKYSDEPYFPFVLQMSAPHGAMPLTKTGVTQVCSECRKSLSRQWRIFESRGVPEQERIYKINDNPIIPMKLEDNSTSILQAKEICQNAVPAADVCYLCGDLSSLETMDWICTRHCGEADDTSRIVLPFIALLKCPTGARPMSLEGKVLVCCVCHDFIIEQWRSYESNSVPLENRKIYLRPVGHREAACIALPEKGNTISEVKSNGDHCGIDSRHNLNMSYQTNSNGRSTGDGIMALHEASRLFIMPANDSVINNCLQKLFVHPPIIGCQPKKCSTCLRDVLSLKLSCFCFLCGSDCGTCEDTIHSKQVFVLRSNPGTTTAVDKCLDSKAGLEKPFFSFIGNLAPAANAEPMMQDGTILSCYMCYHNLFSQWIRFSNSTDLEEQNPWLRRYRYKTIVCYTCGHDVARSKMRVATLDDYPQLNSIESPSTGAVWIKEDRSALLCSTCLQTYHRPANRPWQDDHVPTARKSTDTVPDVLFKVNFFIKFLPHNFMKLTCILMT